MSMHAVFFPLRIMLRRFFLLCNMKIRSKSSLGRTANVLLDWMHLCKRILRFISAEVGPVTGSCSGWLRPLADRCIFSDGGPRYFRVRPCVNVDGGGGTRIAKPCRWASGVWGLWSIWLVSGS